MMRYDDEDPESECMWCELVVCPTSGDIQQRAVNILHYKCRVTLCGFRIQFVLMLLGSRGL
jgi:hypothetical protein